ncbi:hypothetical protein PHYBLDRAFT_63773 [Phycomyces blakesleeanus NRRL 1555(-)]|uniref:Uncharacterized protein n=1 Tax=Phycomyces blakesleeanus (strain ATCC 8743b / DSM 1359 / FGSC 10004 / NBRC 33097 / NRRL 1555) TaxID=763407 RepID=A0A167MQA3_PHYB8|nr:hypothetical protein PHYBLDRAFT_63773 [Phycomyces blakesleeanus NRRL 1555(-)]OAD73526.1 hypothetical protein PHYBLDRAFT_63773 [Phycomyces blakesleeanus NRRL 1555(-)]|eukprot:XP_018291566.1 hypothetical protein PHYBLDRAFT_63773 [Phycomyces blakesleeanus NRRL 1555(-)]
MAKKKAIGDNLKAGREENIRSAGYNGRKKNELGNNLLEIVRVNSIISFSLIQEKADSGMTSGINMADNQLCGFTIFSKKTTTDEPSLVRGYNGSSGSDYAGFKKAREILSISIDLGLLLGDRETPSRMLSPKDVAASEERLVSESPRKTLYSPAGVCQHRGQGFARSPGVPVVTAFEWRLIKKKLGWLMPELVDQRVALEVSGTVIRIVSIMGKVDTVRVLFFRDKRILFISFTIKIPVMQIPVV